MQALDARGFVAYLPGTLAALRSDPRLDVLLNDLSREAAERLRHHDERRRAVRAQVVELHDRVQKLGLVRTSAEHAVEISFPVFPETWRNLVEILRWPELRGEFADASEPLNNELGLIASWLDRRNLGDTGDTRTSNPELFQARLDVENLGNELRHAQRAFLLDSATSPAVAAHRLMSAAANLNPAPILVTAEMDSVEHLNVYVRNHKGAWGEMREHVFGYPSSDGEKRAARIHDGLIQDLTTLHHELRRRLGLRRSLRALVDRYVGRAVWHDAAVLRGLAAKSSSKDDLLTANFARYLYDQGLNPFAKHMSGPLQPELIDPPQRSAFYVEAKHYRNEAGARRVVASVRELWDTLAALAHPAHSIHEAFCLVFQLGGPRLVLPASVQHGQTTLHPVLVNLSPALPAGVRQKDRIVVDPAELLPLPRADQTGTRKARLVAVDRSGERVASRRARSK